MHGEVCTDAAAAPNSRTAAVEAARYNVVDEVSDNSDGLHFHDLSFFVLEVVIDGFNEAIGEFLHFAFYIAQLILAQTAGGLEFLGFLDGSVPIGADTHSRFLGHFPKRAHQFLSTFL